jgi:Predicted ATPase
MINNDNLMHDSIFQIGEVISIQGREVQVLVDQQKNLSHLFYQGLLIKNVSVGGYIKIAKGYNYIIAKVDGERIEEDSNFNLAYAAQTEKMRRILYVKILGYIENSQYMKGIKELPLLGNKCFLLDKNEFDTLYQFVSDSDVPIRIGTLLSEERMDVKLSVNKLFSSHIGIFGNTGSGKSYTLANIYKQLFDKFGENDNFKANAKFLLFDFNGEYSYSDCITKHKKIYDLSTKDTKDTNKYQRIPLLEEDLLDVNLLSILANATEKTQQPFIKRAVSLYKKVKSSQNNISYYHNILQKLLKHILTMQDGVRASLLLDYFEEILPKYDSDGDEFNYRENIDWNATLHTFTINIENKTKYMNSNIDKECISNLDLYTNIDTLNFNEDFLVTIIKFLYIQLIYDVLNSRAQNEHIAPAINKLKAAQKDFDKIFVIDKSNSFWAEDNFVVINLNKVNISMKKLIPMLLSVKLYSEHKKLKDKEALSHSLNIIIDEAHNVLSYESLRESETWKDFRLETFEEIIKEGRKFGVFMTIASQRPSDISPTIISQLHNYFIHRLINNRDIDMVEKAISFLDQLSIDTLPILPTGACILSGTITELPVIVQIDKIDELYKPHSDNIELVKNWI